MIPQTILHYRIVEKLGAGAADSSRITGYTEVIPGDLIAPLLPACRGQSGGLSKRVFAHRNAEVTCCILEAARIWG